MRPRRGKASAAANRGRMRSLRRRTQACFFGVRRSGLPAGVCPSAPTRTLMQPVCEASRRRNRTLRAPLTRRLLGGLFWAAARAERASVGIDGPFRPHDRTV